MDSSGEEEHDGVILSFPSSTKHEEDTNPTEQDFGDRLAGWIASSVAVLLLFGLYTAFSLFVVMPWIQEFNDDDGNVGRLLWATLGLTTFLCALSLWSYVAAMWTSNHIPSTVAAIQSRRYCRYCRAVKPPRTHHCSTCNRCVLKMDHHCPWINNCVGFRNHGYYMRFLFYAVAAMLLGLSVLVARLISLRGRWSYPIGGPLGLEVIELLSLITTVVAFSVLVLMMGGLLVVQVYQALHGYTTIESLEIQRTLRHMDTDKFPFPFDLGPRKNLQLVLGRCIWLWWLPLPLACSPLTSTDATNEEKEGVAFATHPDALMDGQWPLPSKEPLLLSPFNVALRHRPMTNE